MTPDGYRLVARPDRVGNSPHHSQGLTLAGADRGLQGEPKSRSGVMSYERLEHPDGAVFRHACKLGADGIIV
jgi:hypothetical protein